MVGRSHRNIRPRSIQRGQKQLESFRRIGAVGIDSADDFSPAYLKTTAKCSAHSAVPAMLDNPERNSRLRKLLLQCFHGVIAAAVVYKNEFELKVILEQSLQLQKFFPQQSNPLFLIEDGNH